MGLSENRDSWFEQELRRPLSDAAADYVAVEKALGRRIHECEELGVLSLLRIDEICPVATVEEVERELFCRVTQYSQYDEPVDECLRSEADLTEKEWKRLGGKIVDRIQPFVKLPQWEQQFMAQCDGPTVGQWEAIESLLWERISRLDAQLKESWVRYETSDAPVTVSALDTAEELLDEHIVKASVMPYWEQIVSSEEILPYSRWEAVEERLFSAIDTYDELPVTRQPFWHILRNYSLLARGIGITGATVGIIALGVTVFSVMRPADRADMPTVLYRIGGEAAEASTVSAVVDRQCSTGDGGYATLVNAHGSIELLNRATVRLDTVSKERVHYKVDVASSGAGVEGNVAFVVNPGKKNRKFVVTTPEYSISVTGTYFRIDADRDGRVSTHILEGSVRVSGAAFGDTVLKAGQYLRFDSSSGKYRIHGDGRIVKRSEIEPVPAIEELMRYRVLSVRSSVAGAQVFVNGRDLGEAPVAVRQPDGEYKVRVVKEGYEPIDTSFILGGEKEEFVLAVNPVLQSSPEAATEERQSEIARKSVSADIDGDTVFGRSFRYTAQPLRNETRRPPVSAGNSYEEARRAEQNGEWHKALRLYKYVLDDPHAVTLRREDALFSVARIHADHLHDAEAAKQAFLTCLALFPSGTFAGESWLRLAELEFNTNPENAIHYYLKFFDMFPHHPRVAELQDRVGVIYMQRKQYKEAVGMFEKALSNLISVNAADRRGIADHLYRALLDYGDTERAQAVRVRYLASGKKR